MGGPTCNQRPRCAARDFLPRAVTPDEGRGGDARHRVRRSWGLSALAPRAR